jgi:pantoate ligase/cytidylate kinase
MAEQWGAAALWAPSAEQIYPQGVDRHPPTIQVPPGLQKHLCGAVRPGHFDGVVTVVARLLDLVRPRQLWLGEKDWQQLVILRWFVAHLALPVIVQGVATVREADGLALSSRNQYLSPDQRRMAAALPKALQCDPGRWI